MFKYMLCVYSGMAYQSQKVTLMREKRDKRQNNIDEDFSAKCSDIAVNSGSYDPFGNNESHYIDEYGKVVTEKDPYGNLE